MSAGINTTISFTSATKNSATFLLTNQYASETGVVRVFTDSTYSTQVAQSSSVTIYQSSSSVTINGLSSGTSYYADFYETSWGDYTYNGVTFSTQATPAVTYLSAPSSLARTTAKMGQLYVPVETNGTVTVISIDDPNGLNLAVNNSTTLYQFLAQNVPNPENITQIYVHYYENSVNPDNPKPPQPKGKE